MANTYLSLYASGYLNPKQKGNDHDVGSAFQRNAEFRFNKNKTEHPKDIHKIAFIPTDTDVINSINDKKNIKRLDLFSHAWHQTLGLGGFETKRVYNTKTGEKEVRTNSSWDLGDWFEADDTVKKIPVYGNVEYDGSSKKIDWEDDLANKNPNSYTEWRIFRSNEISKISKSAFLPDCEIFLWGCNAGGRYQGQDKDSFAQILAKHIGCTVYAYFANAKTQKDANGAMMQTDANGKEVYEGALLPAREWYNHNNGKNTRTLDPMKFLKKFPI